MVNEARIVREELCDHGEIERHLVHKAHTLRCYCSDWCPGGRRRVLTAEVIESVASELDDRLGPGLWRTYIEAILDALAKSEQDNP